MRIIEKSRERTEGGENTSIMPDTKLVEEAIELSKDESKLLGLKLGAKTVTRGEKIPKAGAHYNLYSMALLSTFYSC